MGHPSLFSWKLLLHSALCFCLGHLCRGLDDQGNAPSRKLQTISYWKFPLTPPGTLVDSYETTTEYSLVNTPYTVSWRSTKLQPGTYTLVMTCSRLYAGAGQATFAMSGFSSTDDAATWTAKYPLGSKLSNLRQICTGQATTSGPATPESCNGFGWSDNNKIYYYKEFTFVVDNPSELNVNLVTNWTGSKRAGFEPLFMYLYKV